MKVLDDGRIEIDNNPAENAIRPSVIGRKNWLFSFSEAGAQANTICLSLAETAKANGIDFYAYLEKLLSKLPNLDFHRQPELLDAYLPWLKISKRSVVNKRALCFEKFEAAGLSVFHIQLDVFFYFGLTT